MKTEYFVYVLQSNKDQGFYTGLTNDLTRRIKQHNNGLVLSTKSRIPLKIVYSENCKSRKEARLREKFLKSGSGRDWLKQKIA